MEDAWPPFEDMNLWLNWDTEEAADPALDIVATEIDDHSLQEEREAAVGKKQAQQEQFGLLNKAKEAINSGRQWELRGAPYNIRAMMRLIEPALKARDAEGTKKQKISY